MCLGPYTSDSKHDFQLADKIFQKTKMEDKKRHKSEKNIRSLRREKAFM